MPRATPARAVFDLAHQGGDLDARLVAAAERLSQGLQVLLRRAARAHGLSPIQAQLLVYLRQRAAGDERRVGELARAFGVTAATVSDALGSLEAKGLARRTGGTRDARVVLAALTAAGRRRAQALAAWADGARTGLAEVSREERATTLGVLLAWIGALQREGVVGVARMCLTCRFFARDAHPGAPQPHHCRLLELPLAVGELRVDCPDHEAA